MPVRFACPTCRKVLKAPDGAAGRAVRCPGCGGRCRVPGDDPVPAGLPVGPDHNPVSPPDDPAFHDTDPDDEPFDYPPPRPAVPPLAAALGVTALLACGLAVVVVVAASAERGRPARVLHDDDRPAFPPPARDDPVAAAADRVQAGAAAAAFVGLAGVAAVLALLWLVGLILMLVWVVKDCRNRGVDGGVLWMLVVLVLHWVGLLVYLASRPHGTLAPCEHCHNKRLAYARLCPHCGRE